MTTRSFTPDTDLLRKCAALIRQSKCEHLLWHYTSMESLLQIIRTRSVAMSSYRFMNDPAEGRHSPAFLEEVWELAIQRSGVLGEINRSHLPPVRDVLQGTSEPDAPQVFLFSLTTLQDTLSQWARYGANGAGVALGFRCTPSELPSTTIGDAPINSPLLCKVLYYGGGENPPEPQDEIAILRESLIQRFMHFLRVLRLPQSIPNVIAQSARLLAPVLKQRAYHEEREWRLVSYLPREACGQIEFRSGRFGLVPYALLPIGQGLKLEQVLVGPSGASDSLWAIDWLCRKYGLNPDIRSSTFHYR